MPRADDRPDPWSPFAMRPAFFLAIATAAVGICGFLVFAYFASRPHRLDVPVDARGGETASIGVYVIDLGYGKVDPTSGVFNHGSVFNKNCPYGLVVAAWDDGRIAWSAGPRPEDGEIVWGMISPQVVASARERIVAAMDDPSRPSEPPYVVVGHGTPESVLFARDGRYQSLRCQTWQVDRDPTASPDVRGDDPKLRPFQEKWDACRAIAMEIIPKESAKQGADWLGFQRDDP